MRHCSRLDTGHWTLDTGHWALDTGHWTLGTGQDVGAHTGAGGECADAIDAGVGADGLAQPLLPHTRSLRTASRGSADLIGTFLVVDACDINSVNTNGCRELDVSYCCVLRFRMTDV